MQHFLLTIGLALVLASPLTLGLAVLNIGQLSVGDFGFTTIFVIISFLTGCALVYLGRRAS